MEIFTLGLQSDDDCVRLGRDLAIARVQANGGISMMSVINTVSSCYHCTCTDILQTGLNDSVCISVVEVNIVSSIQQQINESSGFVEICLEADHQSQSVFEVTLSTTDDTALGK